MAILFLVLGGVLLTAGAEVLIRGATSLAAAARISPLVIGLTIVAFGTSAPELVVSLQSSLRGQADIALGNVVGSNIFNILLILGISALITPLTVSQQLVWLEVPLMIVLSALVLLLGLDGSIGRLDGAFFVLSLVIYTVWSIRQSRKEQKAIEEEYAKEFGIDPKSTTWPGMLLHVAFVVGGLLLLVLGSHWFTDSAVEIARAMHVSELVIGLTIVAAGTSLPEVATSVLAAIRGERDIAVGNAIGSNLFNVMAVLGISSVVSPAGVNVAGPALEFDIPVMIAVAVACLPVFFTGHLIARWEGGLFLGYYLAYVAYLILAAMNARIMHTFGTVMLFFVLPLTVITLLIGVWRARK
jgi:cation:H+ antiporter